MGIPSSTTFMRSVIENGLLWRLATRFVVNAGATYYIGFTTGSSTTAIESRDIASTRDDTLVLLYEDTSYTGGAASITMQNRNRAKQGDSSLNPFSDLKANVTATPSGNPVTGAHLQFLNNGGSLSIPSDPDTTVILLKPLTPHVISFTNGDVLAATVNFGAVVRKDVFIA